MNGVGGFHRELRKCWVLVALEEDEDSLERTERPVRSVKYTRHLP